LTLREEEDEGVGTPPSSLTGLLGAFGSDYGAVKTPVPNVAETVAASARRRRPNRDSQVASDE
jgi:hypothetical protein